MNKRRLTTTKLNSKTNKLFLSMAISLIGLLLLAQQPDILGVSQALAGWTATNLATNTYDAQGIAQISNTNVNEVSAYDATKDLPANQQAEIGVDPNWRNGITKAGSSQSTADPIELNGNQAHSSHTSQLGSTAVNDAFIYDRTKDSDTHVQTEIGIDPNWYNGVVRKNNAVYFDGTDDWINAGSFNENLIKTVSLWIKPENDTDELLDLSGTIHISLNRGAVEAAGFPSPISYVNTVAGDTVTVGVWNFVVITDSTGVDASIATLGVNGTKEYSGYMDEVAFHNVVLTPGEIAQAYKIRRFLPNPTIEGLWHFDETDLNTCWAGSTRDVCNAAGSYDHGSLVGNTTLVSTGKIIMDAGTRPIITGTVSDDASYEIKGAHPFALVFDGIDGKVTVGNIGTGAKTVEFWVKATTTTQKILDLNGSAYIDVTSGTIAATGFDTPTIYVDGIQSTTLPDTNWHHVAITTDTGINASATNLGLIGSTYFAGQLDEVRISSVNRYGSNPSFSPQRHYNDDANSMLLLHFDEGYGTSTTYDDNETGRTAYDGTIAGADQAWSTYAFLDNLIPSSTQVSKALYRWRETGGTWSETRLTSTTPKELKEAGTAEGIYVSWPSENVRIGPEDYFNILSWYIEGSSAGMRSSTQAFPEQVAIYAEDGGLDIIDLSDNTLWMRIAEGASNLLSASTYVSTYAQNVADL